MERPAQTLGLVLAALAMGCGSTSRGTVTLSGSLGTLSLTNVGGSFSSSAQQWLFAVDVETHEDPTFRFSVAGLGTQLPAGVSTPSNTLGSIGMLQASDTASKSENTDTWFVLTGSNVYGGQTGSFELNLTAIGTAEPVQGGVVWQNVHGTFTAVLTPEPANGPAGAANVTLSANF